MFLALGECWRLSWPWAWGLGLSGHIDLGWVGSIRFVMSIRVGLFLVWPNWIKSGFFGIGPKLARSTQSSLQYQFSNFEGQNSRHSGQLPKNSNQTLIEIAHSESTKRSNCQKMESGMISVDKWSSGSQVYFLTHLHADHTVGLSSTWRRGLLYCSRDTAKLFPTKFPDFNLSLIRVVEIGCWHSLSLVSPNSGSATTVYVMAIDANHCPGNWILLTIVILCYWMFLGKCLIYCFNEIVL